MSTRTFVLNTLPLFAESILGGEAVVFAYPWDTAENRIDQVKRLLGVPQEISRLYFPEWEVNAPILQSLQQTGHRVISHSNSLGIKHGFLSRGLLLADTTEAFCFTLASGAIIIASSQKGTLVTYCRSFETPALVVASIVKTVTEGGESLNDTTIWIGDSSLERIGKVCEINFLMQKIIPKAISYDYMLPLLQNEPPPPKLFVVAKKK